MEEDMDTVDIDVAENITSIDSSPPEQRAAKEDKNTDGKNASKITAVMTYYSKICHRKHKNEE